MEDRLINILESLGGVKPNISIEKTIPTRNSLELVKKLMERFTNEVPQSYLSFLKEIGAVSFNFEIKIRGIERIPVENEGVSVDNFYDLANDAACLLNVLEEFQGNLPDNLLPICDGEPGDLVVINMEKYDYGKVYYWYHDTNDIFLLANNFNDFLRKLYIEGEKSTEEIKIKNISSRFLERLKKTGITR